MEHVNRVGVCRQIRKMRRGLRPGDSSFPIGEQPPDEGAQPALREAFGQRIDGNDAVQMNCVLLAMQHYFRFRVIDGAWFERARGAINQHVVSLLEVILYEGKVPPPAM